MTTIRLHGGDLGDEVIDIRCDLTRAESPVMVDYHTDDEYFGADAIGFIETEYQCADARHTYAGLVAIGKRLAARAVELDAVDCDYHAIG